MSTNSTRFRAVSIAIVLTTLAAGCGSDAKGSPSTTVAVTTTSTEATEATETTAAPVVTDPAPTAVAEQPTTTEAVATPPFATQTLAQTFVDTSRPTVPAGGLPQLPSRTLNTSIVYPDAPGPFPLIVLSHGVSGSPARLTEISTAWARAGYVVAMPAFPLTSNVSGDPTLDDVAGENTDDVRNQPADVSFVIDSMLALSGDDSSPLYGRIDADRIGVAGHSLGAATTYGVAFNSCCRDARITAVIILAGLLYVNPDGYDFSTGLPTLIIHGDADETLNIALDTATYARLVPPKWFVTLIGAGHSPAFEDTPSPYDTLVVEATTDFWNGYLGHDASALTALRTDSVVDGLSTLQSSE